MNEISRIIRGIEHNSGATFDELIPLIHDELRCHAAMQMKGERAGHTLTVTALVNEAFIRLVRTPDDFKWDGRRHFFFAAAEAMRRILIEHARKRNSLKRGGDRRRVERELDDLPLIETNIEFDDSDILNLDRALTILETEDPEAANVVKLRFFAGLTYDQIAEQLEVSPRTAKNRWSYARAWLRDFIRS